MLESELKSKGSKLLESYGWLVVHIIQTSKNGWPDSHAYRRGVMWHIEWKQPGASPRPLQSYRIGKLRDQGFETLVITDVKQLEFLK